MQRLSIRYQCDVTCVINLCFNPWGYIRPLGALRVRENTYVNVRNFFASKCKTFELSSAYTKVDLTTTHSPHTYVPPHD